MSGIPDREAIHNHPALRDEATGLANQLHFHLVFDYLFQGADRGVPLAVLMIGILDADEGRLRGFGARLGQITRSSDLVAHLGEGRFVVLLQGANMSGARIAADRIEMGLEGTVPDPLAMALAAYHPDMKQPRDLLGAAERALLRVQEEGGGLEMVSE